MYYVYLLQSKSGKERYVGYTYDLKRRLNQHNNGKNRSTKNRQWELVYYEAFKAKEDAEQRERRLKHDGRARRQLYDRLKSSLD